MLMAVNLLAEIFEVSQQSGDWKDVPADSKGSRDRQKDDTGAVLRDSHVRKCCEYLLQTAEQPA